MTSMRNLMILLFAAALTFGSVGCEEKAKDDGEKSAEEGEGEGAEGEGEGAEGEGAAAEGEGDEAAEGEGDDAAEAEGEATGDEVTIDYTAPKVDEVKTSEESQSMKGKVTPPNVPEPLDMDMTRTKKEIETVLAVSEGERPVVTKLKVVLEDAEKGKIGPQERDDAKPWSGKTYIVDATGDAMTVTYEDGSAVGGIEKDELEKKYRNLGEINPMQEAVIGTPLTVGEEVEVDWEKAKAWMGSETEGTKVTEGSMTLRSVEDGVAIFDVVINLEGEGKMEGTMAMAGEFHVDMATGRLAGTNMEAKLDVTNEVQPNVKVVMDGTMNVEETITWK